MSFNRSRPSDIYAPVYQTIIGSDSGLGSNRNQCWSVANLAHGNKLYFNPSFDCFTEGNAYENIVCEMAAILSQAQYV